MQGLMSIIAGGITLGTFYALVLSINVSIVYWILSCL